jgi:dTDP-4-dehydrorhamnose reductase (EC 1.1.1.133)
VKKILLIGKNGQLGYELERTLAVAGEVIALNSSQLNLTDTQQLRSTLRNIAPDIIINAAAYTAVDQAEAGPDLAMAINGIAPAVMGEEAQRLDALLIHYSTDYVFDGSKTGAYTEQDAPNPLSVYGKTKLHGEQAITKFGLSAFDIQDQLGLWQARQKFYAHHVAAGEAGHTT